MSRPDEESCDQHAEDEPADVSEERDAAPVRLGVEQPEAPSISWYRNHSPSQIQAGILMMKIGKIHVVTREPGYSIQ